MTCQCEFCETHRAVDRDHWKMAELYSRWVRGEFRMGMDLFLDRERMEHEHLQDKVEQVKRILRKALHRPHEAELGLAIVEIMETLEMKAELKALEGTDSGE